jgi:glycosyl-4,4'-diaponeurosporenoate acyltransferase
VNNWAIVALDIAVWGGWSALVGFVAHKRPVAAFADDTWLYRLRDFERAGAFYERIAIRRWKDRLPEAGGLFTGGFSKRSVRTLDRTVLERFVAETRRAEWTHWMIMSITPVFVLWNWWWVDVLMVVYALCANLPCLVVQRYNRARLSRLLRA